MQPTAYRQPDGPACTCTHGMMADPAAILKGPPVPAVPAQPATTTTTTGDDANKASSPSPGRGSGKQSPQVFVPGGATSPPRRTSQPFLMQPGMLDANAFQRCPPAEKLKFFDNLFSTCTRSVLIHVQSTEPCVVLGTLALASCPPIAPTILLGSLVVLVTARAPTPYLGTQYQKN